MRGFSVRYFNSTRFLEVGHDFFRRTIIAHIAAYSFITYAPAYILLRRFACDHAPSSPICSHYSCIKPHSIYFNFTILCQTTVCLVRRSISVWTAVSGGNTGTDVQPFPFYCNSPRQPYRQLGACLDIQNQKKARL